VTAPPKTHAVTAQQQLSSPATLTEIPEGPGADDAVTTEQEALAENSAGEKTEILRKERMQKVEILPLVPGEQKTTLLAETAPVIRYDPIDYSATAMAAASHKLELEPIVASLNTGKKATYSWGIGGDFGPVFSYRNLPVKTEYTRFLNGQEEGTLSYGGTFSVFVQRKKRLSLQSGIGYYRTGQVSTDMVAFRQIKSGNLAVLESKGNNYLYNSGGDPGYDHVPLFIANRRDPAGNDQTEYILTNLGNGLYEPVDAELKLDYEFVEVPLLLRYQIVDRAFGVNVTGGLGASLLFHSAATVLTADGQSTLLGEVEGLRRTNINSTLGVGVSYRITQDFLFRLEPTFKYYINPVSRNEGIDSHPFLFGIYSGLSIFF